MTKYRLNDEEEYKDLKEFTQSDKFVFLAKPEKQAILNRLHVLEQKLGYDLTPYNHGK